MKEALDALESEREQKYEMKKKLEEKINNESMLNISNFGLRFPGLAGISKRVAPVPPRIFPSRFVSLSSPISLHSKSFEHSLSRTSQTSINSSESYYTAYSFITPTKVPLISRRTPPPKVWFSFGHIESKNNLSRDILILIKEKRDSLFAKGKEWMHLNCICIKQRCEKRISSKNRCHKSKPTRRHHKQMRLNRNQVLVSMSPQRTHIDASRNKSMSFRDENNIIVSPSQFKSAIRNRISSIQIVCPDLDVKPLSLEKRNSRSKRCDQIDSSKRVNCISCMNISFRVIVTCCLGLFSP